MVAELGEELVPVLFFNDWTNVFDTKHNLAFFERAAEDNVFVGSSILLRVCDQV